MARRTSATLRGRGRPLPDQAPCEPGQILNAGWAGSLDVVVEDYATESASTSATQDVPILAAFRISVTLVGRRQVARTEAAHEIRLFPWEIVQCLNYLPGLPAA